MNPLERWRWRRGSKRHLAAINGNVIALVEQRDEARHIAALLYEYNSGNEVGNTAYREASWNLPDPRDLESIYRGMEDAAAGRLVDRGSFAQYAEEPDDD